MEELLADATRVRGKAGILFDIARAALDDPDGAVCDVIFPVAGPETFERLVKEAAASGGARSARIHTAVRASYGSYYRRMLPRLLAALEFRSTNAVHRPLLDAIEAIRAAVGGGQQYHDLADIAVDGVIRPKWRDIVIETAPDGRRRVNRINYEICALQSLREKLRCKEVWVVGADRWRDPGHGPADGLRRAARGLLRAPRPAARRRCVHRRASGRDDGRPRVPERNAAARSLRSGWHRTDAIPSWSRLSRRSPNRRPWRRWGLSSAGAGR